jgi:hypothetical protein
MLYGDLTRARAHPPWNISRLQKVHCEVSPTHPDDRGSRAPAGSPMGRDSDGDQGGAGRLPAQHRGAHDLSRGEPQRHPLRLRPGEAAPIFLLTIVFAAQIATVNGVLPGAARAAVAGAERGESPPGRLRHAMPAPRGGNVSTGSTAVIAARRYLGVATLPGAWESLRSGHASRF